MSGVPETETATRPRGALGRRGPTRKYQAKRDAIVRSAIEQINLRGLRGTTLGSVAAQLGLVSTAVIYYFASKEDLAGEVFLRGIRRFEAMIGAAQAAGGAEARIAAFAGAYFADRARIAAGELEGIAYFNDVRALNAGPVNEAYVRMFRAARELVDRERAMSRGRRNARTHLLLSQMFWIVGWLHHAAAADYPRVGRKMARILNRGLRAPGAPWPTPVPLSLIPPQDPQACLSAEQFLRAATQVINEEGYQGASVDRISARLNVSKGAFYHHNETKDELVVACFQRTFEITWRAIHAAEAGGGCGLAVLVTVATALIEHQMRGDSPLLRTSALTTVPEAIRRDLSRELDRISYRFAAIVCDGVEDGSIAPVDVNIAAQMITGAINAAAELHFWTPGLTAEAVTGLYIRPLFEGLASRPDATS
jgi:AcrR family transcriptional regulator